MCYVHMDKAPGPGPSYHKSIAFITDATWGCISSKQLAPQLFLALVVCSWHRTGFIFWIDLCPDLILEFFSSFLLFQ